MRARLHAAALSLALALSGASLLATPAAAADRRRTVAGWQVESVSEQDGGRLVRLSRRGRGWRFEHHLAFWRGNGGIVLGASFRGGDCRSGDADMTVGTATALSREGFDGRLADYLRECPLPEADAAALRRGIDAAWPLFTAWAWEAEAATEAEAAAVARYDE